MRTNLVSFIAVSENRKRILKTMLEYPKRQWSCPALEDITKLPHATVFRTLIGLKHFGVVKATRINRRDLIYELANLPLLKELEKLINAERAAARSLAASFVYEIKSRNIYSAILYGSTVKGEMKPESDIDVLVVMNKHDNPSERDILNIAARLSSEANKTISTVIMDKKQLKKEKNSQFIKSVKENMEVLYGKIPF